MSVELMASSEIKSGALVSLEDLHLNSPFFKQGALLRVTGKLEECSPETATFIIVDGGAKLKINTEQLREISSRIGSICQFIGELLIQPDNEVNQFMTCSVNLSYESDWQERQWHQPRSLSSVSAAIEAISGQLSEESDDLK